MADWRDTLMGPGNWMRYGSWEHTPGAPANPAPTRTGDASNPGVDYNNRTQSSYDFATNHPALSTLFQPAVDDIRYAGSNISPVLALNPFADQSLWGKYISGITASPDQLLQASQRGAAAGSQDFARGYKRGQRNGNTGNRGTQGKNAQYGQGLYGKGPSGSSSSDWQNTDSQKQPGAQTNIGPITYDYTIDEHGRHGSVP